MDTWTSASRSASVPTTSPRPHGTRSFPWRAFVLARRDADLVATDMVTRLAPPPAPGADFSWLKPGKVVWDYWADWNLEGVDFAAKHGFP